MGEGGLVAGWPERGAQGRVVGHGQGFKVTWVDAGHFSYQWVDGAQTQSQLTPRFHKFPLITQGNNAYAQLHITGTNTTRRC